MKTKLTLTLIFLLFMFTQVQAQQIDSAKIDLWVNAARQLLTSNPDSVLKVGFAMREYSIDKEYPWGHAQGDLFISAVLHRKGLYDSAIYYTDEVLQINETLLDSLQIATASINKGMCLVSTGRYDEGAEFTLQAMRYSEPMIDRSKPALGTYIRCFNIMGQVYYYQSDFEKTRDYFLRYLEEATKAQDTLLIASANNNLGAVYYELKDFEKTLYHDSIGATIHKSLNNLMGYSNAMQNIASDLIARREYDRADQFLQEALAGYREIPNEKGISEVYAQYGSLYREKNNLTKSAEWYDKTIVLCKRIGNTELQKNVSQRLAHVYEAMNRYQQAYELYRQFHLLSDSLVNLNNKNKISELEIAYETEKKQRQLELQTSELARKELEIERNQTTILSLALVLLVIIGVAIWYYKRRQYKQEILMKEQRSILKADQIKAVIKSQEEERKRFAMDLHDDFGQLISALRMRISHVGDDATSLLDQMYGSLKNIAFNLMPHTLMEKGLVTAIDELCTQLNNSGQVQFKLTTFEISDEALKDQKIEVYRVIQEVVNNILKYANATHVNISMTGLEGELNIMIEDDGAGFDVDRLTKGLGNGWRNISSRLELVQGYIEIDSQPERNGTTVAISIPLIDQVEAAA